MSDPGAELTPSEPPPVPSDPRPSVTSQGRMAAPVASSNADAPDLKEFEFFGTPRGLPPLTEFLDVLGVDMLRKPQENNRRLHHTDVYSSTSLLVRRGQEFHIQLTFNRPFMEHKDRLAAEFVIGSSPNYSKGTYVPVFFTKERQTSWAGRVVQKVGSVLTVGITPAADCIVGKYHMYIAVVTPYGIRRTPKDESRDLYVLFNPWAAEDTVFLDDEREREECVMNEVGIIYHGTHDDIAERDWNYGQFNYGVLDACLYILDRSKMPIVNRGDPVRVVRKVSAMLNSKDDDGVLVGNWAGDYTYGVAPTSWTGSTDILVTYASTHMPVCYAQCWVYAGVFNTVLRCLGIPSRLVTNFYSAHDNNGNLKIDVLLDEDGRMDRSRTKDSIWNYHCWNECFMARPDLPAGFGGWQVVDATPQETSDGLYRCGPASVQAIKHGQICFPFDGPFIFSEVNSDVVFYSRAKDGTLEVVKVNRSHVGRKILTKAPGELTHRDITGQYKYEEGTPEERAVVEKAVELGCQREKTTIPAGDVDVVLPALEVSVGADFDLSLDFVNKSNQQRSVKVYISGSVVFYTGVAGTEFLFDDTVVTLGPKMALSEVVEVEAEKYMKHLVEQANLHFIVTGKVTETNQIISAMKVVSLHTPKISIQVTGSGRVHEEMTARVHFKNPLSFGLEGVFIRMEGPALLLPKRKFYSSVPAGASLTWTEHFAPHRVGTTRLIVTLDCPALRQVHGAATIDVRP